MTSISPRVAALLVLGALCAACGGSGTDQTGAPAAQSGKATTSPGAADDPLAAADKQTADMVHGVSPGKAAAPVDLKFNLLAKPELGKPLAIDVALIATGASESMTLAVQPAEGLDVDSASSRENFPKSQVGALYHHQISVTPRAEGAFFVNVVVTTVVPGGPQSRSFAIPVLVGGVAALDKNASPDAAGGTGG
jgi:hypothetical protein